ncbi:MAG: TetR/AcrR family transcriptional regulator [Bacteroidales bacterium]
MTFNKEIWIKIGYEIFSLSGKSGLKVEPLAKKVGKSKSSFYHFFADMESFIEELLTYHIDQSYIIAKKELMAKKINPELINIIVEHKTDILFNRQLRINRENKIFSDVLIKSNEIVGNAFVMLWVRDLGLKFTKKQLESIFELALENFYLQITPSNLNNKWLLDYFINLEKIVRNFG